MQEAELEDAEEGQQDEIPCTREEKGKGKEGHPGKGAAEHHGRHEIEVKVGRAQHDDVDRWPATGMMNATAIPA